jgi:hypothetical protein
MCKEHNVVSVSGGKDSTALLLLAIERGAENLQAVFADTGHEHPQTYEYVQYLNDKVFPIRTSKAKFTDDLARKARFVAEKWKPMLMAEPPGGDGWWEYVGPGAPADTPIVEDARVAWIGIRLNNRQFQATRTSHSVAPTGAGTRRGSQRLG